MDAGRRLYTACCESYGVKPNRDIMNQVDRPDLMNLKKIDASKTFLGNIGVHAVIDFVRQHRGIVELLLPKNDVDGVCIERLCLALHERHPSLSSVDLSENMFATPSVRLLWTAARQSPNLVEIRLDGCTVTEEWRARLQRALDANKELSMKGFFRYGPDRPLDSWQTSFVLIMGGNTKIRELYQHCILRINSYLAASRVRVAPIFALAKDTTEQALTKVNQCRESFNYNQTFCVVFLDESAHLSKSQLQALMEVLQQRRDQVLPIRTKTGEIDAPVHRLAPSCFIYLPCEGGGLGKVRAVPPAEWLPIAGITETQADSLGELTLLAHSIDATTAPVRCESDLCSSLTVIFSEDPSQLRHKGAAAPSRPAQEGDAVCTNDAQFLKRAASLGALHVKKSAVVLNYIDDASNTLSVPLILYGERDIGKSEILAHIAEHVTRRNQSGESMQQWRSYLYIVDVNDSSVVIFLYWVLRAFNPDASLAFSCIEELCATVHETLNGYTGPPAVLLIARADGLDACGSYFNVTTDWLPSVLPPQLKIVVTVDTGSQVLACLRQLTPQPHECIVPPLSQLNQLKLVKRLLSATRAEVPGLEPRAMRDGDELRLVEKAYVQKEGSASLLYAFLSAAYLEFLVKTRKDITNEYDTADMVKHSLPQSTDALIVAFCRNAEEMHDALTARYVLLCLAVAPLPIPAVLYICEELGPCARYTALPALLQFTQCGLVGRYADSRACIVNATVRATVLRLYSDDLDAVSVLVENHLLRLVMTRSAEMSFSFRHLIPLFIHSGNFSSAVQLVQNAVIIDCVLQADVANRFYVIDAYYRLLMAAEIVHELAVIGEPLDTAIDDTKLYQCLRDVQLDHSGSLLQSQLLTPGWSPLARDARERLGQAPYPVVRVLNDGDEDSSTATWYATPQSPSGSPACGRGAVPTLAPMPAVGAAAPNPITHLHARGHFVVASARNAAYVFNSALGEVCGTLPMPFEGSKAVIGSLLSIGSRVVVIGEDQMLIWDFEGNTTFHFEGLTAIPRASSLDSFGVLLLVTRTGVLPLHEEADRSRTCVLDITRRHTRDGLPARTHSARFCGDTLVVCVDNDLLVLDGQMNTSAQLPHNGCVREVECSTDGRLIASSVGGVLYVWTRMGDLVHRVECGLSPVTRLHFEGTGSYLLTEQPEGAKVWRVLTGALVAALESPFPCEGSVQFTQFSEDGGKLLGRMGRRIVVWDVQTGRVTGVITAPAGLFTFMLEQGGRVLTALTGASSVKLWSLTSALPSVKSARAGTVTSNLLRNAKVTAAAVRSLSVDPSGSTLVAVDAADKAFLYSLSTGANVAHHMGPARAAVAVSEDCVALVPAAETELRFYHIGTGRSDVCVLPKCGDASADFRLYRAEDERSVAVTHVTGPESVVSVVSVEDLTVLFCFSTRAACTLSVSFFGSFVYTAAEDRCVRLWSQARRAERASYEHHNAILCAGGDTTGMFFFLDSDGDVYRVHTDNITSPSHASFVVTRLVLDRLRACLSALPPAVSLLCAQGTLVVLTAENGILIASADRDTPVNTITQLGVACAALGELRGHFTLCAGSVTGRVLLGTIVSAEGEGS